MHFLKTLFPLLLLSCAFSLSAQAGNKLCSDGFCIGDSIHNPHFSEVDWITPNKEFTKESCVRIACKPEVAFRGYPIFTQKKLADALSWAYGSIYLFNVVTKENLEVLRQYAYECSGKDRHFIAAYMTSPSHYLSIIGLRLIGSELRIYRIVRQYPYRNEGELQSLARKLRDEYGENIVYYDGIASNAYSTAVSQKKNGWFGRSSTFNPLDPSDNAAELVLIDPQTRALLQPMAFPESGDISHLRTAMPSQCSRSLPLQ